MCTPLKHLNIFSEHKVCSAEEFSCKNEGECIPMNWVCDQTADCADKSDEAFCSKYLSCADLLLLSKKESGNSENAFVE